MKVQTAELQRLVAGAIPWTPSAIPETKDEIESDSRLDDIGNARRFARDHRGRTLYVPQWKEWLYWDAKRWARDTGSLRAMELAKQTARNIYGEAGRCADSDKRAAIAGWANKSAKRERLTAMIALAASEPGMSANAEEFDVDPWLLNVLNGTIDLRTGELRRHAPDNRITKLVSIIYDPAATAPRFEQFLNEIFAGDKDLIAYVLRAIGYSLTGAVSEKCFFICYGPTDTGKSKFFFLLELIGGEFFHQADPELFCESKNQRRVGEATPHLTALRGVRIAVASETSERRRLAERNIKVLTGGESLNARALYENETKFPPSHKLWLGTNHKPKISQDGAVWNRVRLIPFNVVFPKDKQDKSLEQKFRIEASGILALAVRGCLEWQRLGELMEPPAVVGATEDYEKDEDVAGKFLQECCVRDTAAWVAFKDLRAAAKDWAENAGESEISNNALTRRLDDLGFPSDKGAKGRRIRLGVKLKEGGAGGGCDSILHNYSLQPLTKRTLPKVAPPCHLNGTEPERERFEERAGIREFDGNFPRLEAEKLALEETQ